MSHAREPEPGAARPEDRPIGPLAIHLSCPQCGAPSVVDDETVSTTCAHCKSFLVIARPGREQFFLAQSQVAGPEDIRNIVILYRTQAHRAELVARFGSAGPDGEQTPPPEPLIEQMLRRFEERLLRQMQVLEAHRFQAPYWHLAGSVLQATLGRRRDGPKEITLRAYGVEHSVPGYDTARANLRDLGLRLSRARLLPLTRKRVATEGPFLPWLAARDRSYQEILKWVNRDLTPDIEDVMRKGGYVFGRRLLVYRSYWLAHVTSDEGARWILVDGGFGTIAGYPAQEEARALLRQGVSDPEDAESRETRAVVRPARCPDCGVDQRFAPSWQVAVCDNCHLALKPEPEGLQIVPYDHGAFASVDLDGCFLPFWSYPLRLTAPGAPLLTRLEEYAKLLFPQGIPPSFSPRGDHLLVPAFRLLGTEVGDRAFHELGAALHAQPPEVHGGKLPLGGRPRFEAVTVPEKDAREALLYVLFALHNRPSAARLNTRLVQKAIVEAKLEVAPGRLLMVPFERSGDDLVIPGTEQVMPGLLLGGGPELEAMRATVWLPGAGRV